MRRLILVLLLCCSAVAGAASPSFGQHGMALFGNNDGLYASHLPMFHAPHDVQLILELRLADPALDRAVRARLDGKPVLWTLSPEDFELDRLAPGNANPLKSFKADLVLGHFERGGSTVYKGVVVMVDRVLYYRKLSAAARMSDAARYMQVGGDKQRFLVKEIDSRPDFDHIVAISTGAATARDPLLLPKAGIVQPAPAALLQALPGASLIGTIYFETDDLK